MAVKFDTLWNCNIRTLMSSAALATCLVHPALAQDADLESESPDTIAIETTEEDTDVKTQEKIVVTGSRISRDTFTSISPVQVITTDFSREIGLVDSADILQDSTAASGQQIDDTFQGFVLDNGPGSSTVSLRGLGAGRTLALINGRRMAPIGVEGAPADPSVNFIPSSFIGSYEILLDGASSIYGSDAVAGVVNAIIRKDYDGLEFGINLQNPQAGGGDFYNLYGSWGKQMDKGFVAVAFDYEQQNRVKLSQREWSQECERIAEITESGEVRTQRLDLLPGMDATSCDIFPLGGRMSLGSQLSHGSVYYTPGFTNTGIANFSESSLFSVLYDGNSDGLADFSFSDYTSNGSEADRNADLIGKSDAISFMAIGDYDIGMFGNAQVYGEFMYLDGEFESKSVPGQIFEFVPGTNPFNPCNPNGLNGVDCGTAVTDYGLGPQGATTYQNFVDTYGAGPDVLDFFFGTRIVPGAVGPVTVRPIVGISGDRDNVKSELSQTRAVAGMKGDLEFVDFGSVENWTYDVSLTYSKSEGKSSRLGIREDRLLASLNTSAIVPGTTNVVCGEDTNGDGIPDGALADGTPCVPVNFFADSVLGTPVGDFATQAERDYLFGDRAFETTYEQLMFQAYTSGDLFEIPTGGTAAGVLGFEYRNDKLDSNPNQIASDGLLWGFFADRGAFGEMRTVEAYSELELPLVLDKPGFTELTVNLSGRYTDTEFAGEATTYAAKVGWRPIDSLLVRGTFGTSFRAPNVREQFLEGQSGFATLGDPCAVPELAFDPIGGYDATQDTRDQVTLDNCVAAGVDPTTLGGGNISAYSVEVFQTGASANPLDPEESESYSYGFVFEQPFTDWIDATIGVTYYNIDVEKAIESQSPGSVVANCYITVANFQSPFCANITRGADGFLDEVDYEFENIAQQIASGYDFNVLVEKDIAIGGRDLDIAFDLRANKLEEVSRQVAGEEADQFVGEFYFPEWTAQASLRLDYDDFRFTWRADWQDEVQVDADFLDGFDVNLTCLGPPDDELCRPIEEADAYITHDASVRYSGEDWLLIVGANNLFDEEPPFVSASDVFTARGTNAPPGAGYDFMGRTFFVSFVKEF